MNKVILIQNGELLNGSPVGSETGPVGGPVSGTEGTEKATIDKSIVSQYRPSVKEFETVRAQLALRAHTLTAKPHQSGLTLWEVGKWGQVRVFSHWNDVLAFRAQIGV